MKSADEFQQVLPSLFFWQAYEPEVKADLSSCAVALPCGLVFIDPIPLHPAALEELASIVEPCAVVLTNGNHERASTIYREQFGIPIYASPEAKESLSADLCIEEGSLLCEALEVIALPGFGPGEIALHWAQGEGIMMLGDAVVNFGSAEFTLLPDKYCQDPKLGRISLRKLLGFKFETMMFAHGTPVPRGAKARLEKIL